LNIEHLLQILLVQLPKKQKSYYEEKELRKYINHREKDFIYLDVNSLYPYVALIFCQVIIVI